MVWNARHQKTRGNEETKVYYFDDKRNHGRAETQATPSPEEIDDKKGKMQCAVLPFCLLFHLLAAICLLYVCAPQLMSCLVSETMAARANNHHVFLLLFFFVNADIMTRGRQSVVGVDVERRQREYLTRWTRQNQLRRFAC